MGKQYSQLTMEERVEIYRLHADGKSRRAIGALLGRSAATISRELRRNSLKTRAWGGGYAGSVFESLKHPVYALRDRQASIQNLFLAPICRNGISKGLAVG